MASDIRPLVDVGDIIRLVGRPAFDRGREYARSKAVAPTSYTSATGVLTARVTGTGIVPYRCSVTLVPRPGESSKPVDSRCSCPMGVDCKHVAAMLLEHNGEAVRALDTGGIGPASKLTGSGWAAPSRAFASSADAFFSAADNLVEQPAAQPAGPRTWKDAVSAITPRVPQAPGAARTQLGLIFELREQTPRTHNRWRGPTAKSAGRTIDQSGDYRLGVRPVTRSGAGNWVRTTVTWNTLTYQSNRLNLDPAQQRWFAQFGALYRATREFTVGHDLDWVYLDDFHSPLLWGLLDSGRTAGIAMVGGTRGSEVVIGREATIGMELSASTADDASAGVPDGADGTVDASAPGTAAGLALTASLTIDGREYPAAAASTIGDHGVYAWQNEPRIVTLAASSTPITEEHRRLLGPTKAVTVPASDVGEFWGEYFPRLRRAVTVTSASIDLPELVPPVLVLTATFAAKHELTLAWHWDYQGTRRPMRTTGRDTAADDAAEPRDDAVELDTLTRVDTALGLASTTPAPGTPAPSTRAPGTRPSGAPSPTPIVLRGLDAAEFASTVLPRIDLPGVRVDVVGEQPDYKELTAAPTLTVTTVETEHRDWFDLGVLVTVEGRQVPFAPLFSALATGKTKLLLVDNSYLSLTQPVFDELRRLIDEASGLDEWETGVRISRYQASLWSEFEDLADETEQAQGWRASVSGLLAAENVDPVAVPAALDATLRPYQLDGYHWLAFLHAHGLGGILADDMGLGKTLQALALVAHAVEKREAAARSSALDVAMDAAPPASPAKPFLVVAPTSVVSNWLSEAHRFTPSLAVRGITATQTKSGRTLADDAAGADLVVTSYALFRLDFAAYQDVEWAGLILDEAQFVKNPASKAHRAAVDLNTPVKIAITGTPMENSLTDLWALLQIVAPGLFPSGRRFAEEYVRPIAAGGQPELVAKLRRRIRPLMMRRTKELVATELPEKQEQVLAIDLAPRHRALYDTVLQRERAKLLGLIEDLDKNRFIVFRSLTLLRMLSLDASLVDEKYADIPSSKLDALFEQLGDVVAEGHRSLVFSQFTTFLRKAAERLDAQGIAYEYLDGSTLHRADVIARFKDGTAPVFLISLKAGGFGLNLTEADYVFLLDPWWNPATEAQAVDRTHRIGQTRNVMVYRLVASGTIEEKVMALKEKKARLFDAVMDDDAAFSTALTASDIRGLLEG
ncbi:DEAD/DEAH box helicase [Marisediminicola senii]|uniref:DEAD/DEAH box helicase n=1 Tax=Marisediminicola senii TaxID=2711233 RepID=UPI0013EA176C|nr:DEAD/DEAH box helicase [Marisediminicola senii]